MKKLTLLCRAVDRERALERLRDLGVLHLAHMRPPESGDLEAARRHLAHVRRALEVLPPRGAERLPSGEGNYARADRVVEEIWELIRERRDLEEKVEDLLVERRRIAPFGNFDPDAVRRLAAAGVHLKLYRMPPRGKPEASGDSVLIKLRQDRDGVYCAVAGLGEVALPGAEEVRLPDKPLGEIDGLISGARERLAEVRSQLESYASYHRVVVRAYEQAEKRVLYLEARDGMGLDGPLAYLGGYFPAGDEERITRAAREQGWGVRIADPGPGDKPPTYIVNPRWVKPIKAVFRMTGLVPGYKESDISVPFLFFLSLYFAMLVGDAGYGLLFIGLTFLARLKLRNVPAHVIQLLYVMSFCTVLWGALSGTWFGLPREGIPRLPILNDEEFIKLLCFLLGAVHLSVAHAWRAVRLAPSFQALAQGGWVGSTWVMFLAARHFLLDEPFPAWGTWLLAVSVLCIALFSVPLRRIRQEGVTLATLPLDVISNFTDVVSYLRLFAVGTATYAVAYAFNDMIAPLMGGFIGALGGALLLFAGHALNIGLCSLGVLVHGVRLNTLEFSSHMGMQWTGYAYDPFGRNRDVSE